MDIIEIPDQELPKEEGESILRNVKESIFGILQFIGSSLLSNKEEYDQEWEDNKWKL